MAKEVLIEITGMHCNSCAKIIRERLLEFEGIEKAEVSYAEENAKIVFDQQKTSLNKIKEVLLELGYGIKGESKNKKSNMTLKQGLVYGLVPHIGCIGFIAASILGVTVAIELFRPLLMNPWFFHILILIAIGFATISSAFYLKKNGLLSWSGVKRKKKYLATMYGSTVGINLVLFLLVFPMLANLDTGSFANTPQGALALAGAENQGPGNSLLEFQVNIPCPGHAPLISGELKTIKGVTGVRFNFPNSFDVAFDSGKTSKQEILSLEVFETYNATVVSETIAEAESVKAIALAELKEVEEISASPFDSAGSCGGSCGGNCGGCGCGS